VSLIFVYITNPNKKEAKSIAKYLLSKKLIACVNIYSNINSLYPWKGKLADETEVILIAKTIDKNYQEIKQEVKKIHSYTIPCIMKIPVEANKEYADWLKSELRDSGS